MCACVFAYARTLLVPSEPHLINFLTIIIAFCVTQTLPKVCASVLGSESVIFSVCYLVLISRYAFVLAPKSANLDVSKSKESKQSKTSRGCHSVCVLFL